MKITKTRLKEIIKEEVQNIKEARGWGNETEITDDDIVAANQGFEEGASMSRAISRLEDIGETVKGVLQISDDPETIERLERVDQMITDLWDQMHDLLDVPSNNVQMQRQE